MELDEVENIFLDTELVHSFKHRLNLNRPSLNPASLDGLFYNFQEYVTENLKKAHDLHNHSDSDKRNKKITNFLNNVRMMQDQFLQAQLHNHRTSSSLFHNFTSQTAISTVMYLMSYLR